ncbi:hypothetical protein LBMAG18_09760 [Alphaproteobacteria bacterium]|nr:hypothetical protein LBMAG18_09760 [Alphaproteobacteria bacterium]
MKKLKILIPTIAIYASLSTASFAAIGGGLSTVPTGQSPFKSFSESAVGAGLAFGVRFNLTEDIFTDSENKNSKTKDHIFTEIEVFGSQFFSGEIKQNFGARLNLGYEIKGIRIYGSGGYVSSSIDYQEIGNNNQSINASAPFFGIGLGYDITKNIGIRLNSMFYNFNFTPKNSQYRSVEVDASAVTIDLAVHF